MKKYEKTVKGGKGGILLCVNRGRLSEGYDFPDGMCRAVFMVGIPFPPTKDLKINEKKNYLNN